MSQNKPLTARQERFCHHYIKTDFNQSEAARLAGYAQESAHVEGNRLLKIAKVKKRIEELSENIIKRANATEDEIFEFLTFAANFDPTVWVNVTAKGQMLLKCDLDQLPKMVKKMVTEIKPTAFGVQVKWYSKEKAVESLARFHGMNNDKVAVTNSYENAPDDVIDARLKELGE